MLGPFSKLNIHSMGHLMQTGQVIDSQQTKQFVYRSPCVCSSCCTDETSRHLEEHIKEYKHNETQGLLEKSRLTPHSYEEGHKIFWRAAKVYADGTEHHLRK
jgi:hypothetical protein